VAVSVRLTIFMHRIALPFGAFTEYDQRVVARVGALVLQEQLDELIEISGTTQRMDVAYAVWSAVNPESRPKTRKTPMRSCEPTVVRCRWIASLARVIAVENPMQYSVLRTSLSIVFGSPTILTPNSLSSAA
jgi:hypothetical protein